MVIGILLRMWYGILVGWAVVDGFRVSISILMSA